MIIYNPNGTPLLTDTGGAAAHLMVGDDSYRMAELMGDDCLMLIFSLAEPVTFPLRCYTVFEGQTYYLFSSPEITKQHNRQYDYTMPMYTSAYLLHITMMRNVVTNYSTGVVGGDLRLSFPLTAKPREHVQMIADCLNVKDSGWTVEVTADVENTEKLVAYEFVYCDDALRAVATAYDTEYEIVGKHIILGKVEHNKNTPLSMSYGKGNGFKSGVARRNESDMPPIDRLYIQGGEQNIPEHYGMLATTSNGETTYSEQSPNHIKNTTLLLPKGAACFYHGGSFYFSKNPTVRYQNDGTPYVQAKDYRDYETNLPVYEVLYDNQGNSIGTTLLMVPTPCFLVSADGRSLQRVRHTYYDPEYTPRGSNVEAYFDASEIYPMRVGSVTAVASVNGGTGDNGEQITFYDIYDATAGCPNYRDCYIAGETMTVIFQDGMLAGREFDLNTYSSGQYKDQPVCETVTTAPGGGTFVDGNGNTVSAKKMELCQAEQDGLSMPGGNFVPRAGDHYIVFHCSLPEEYVSGIAYGAEYQALREATFYLYHHGTETYTFSGAVDGLWAKRVWDDIVQQYNTAYYNNAQIPYSTYFALGQHIKVRDVQLFGAQGLTMRVTGIKQPVNNPRAIEMTLTNALTLKFDWVRQLSQTVQDVRVRPRRLRPNQYAFPRNLLGLRQRHIDLSATELRIGGHVRAMSLAPISTVNELGIATANLISGHNSVVTSLTKTQQYVNQIRLACNRMRELIAINSGWSGVTYNTKTQEITGIQEVGDGGGNCVENYGCAVPYTNIEVPQNINQL